jgi:hypothetical protein
MNEEETNLQIMHLAVNWSTNMTEQHKGLVLENVVPNPLNVEEVFHHFKKLIVPAALTDPS